MDKEQVKSLLSKIDKYIPVSVIEKELKMPVNTLQKVLSETEKQKRNLPKKWIKPLTDWINFKRWITISYFKSKVSVTDLNKKSNVIDTPKQDESNYTIDNEPQQRYMSDAMRKRLYGK